MSGDALDAYRAHADGLVRRLGVLAAAAQGVARALRVASTVIGAVAGLVRDALAQVVGSAISALAEETLSLGLATPFVVAQVVTKVARLAARVGTKLRALLASVRELNLGIGRLEAVLRRLGNLAVGRDVHIPVRSDGSFARRGTRPSSVRSPEARSRGTRERIKGKSRPEHLESILRQNESAETLARGGYDVVRGPVVAGQQRPDFAIEGKVFDNYAPTVAEASGVRRALLRKLNAGQAASFVVNLDDTVLTPAELEAFLRARPPVGVDEVIAIKGARIVHVFVAS